ncbi:adenosylcobinamide-GDP ribazoletransferase [Streptomyces lavendulae]|uniref:adenosylcobinamide-GDP ribazoletransferase n=1 Tax=Streptomyces lavendulae TaxID=1914 RepID=UPI00368C4974
MPAALQHAAAVAAGLLAADLLLRRCVRRFGGVTGDVFGALCEVAATTALVTLSLG